MSQPPTLLTSTMLMRLWVFIVGGILSIGCERGLGPGLPVNTIQSTEANQVKDLGAVKGSSVTHEFGFRNTDCDPMVVTSIRKNCGCTITNLEVGRALKCREQIPVSITLHGKSSGGLAIGELWIETTSQSMKVASCKLTLSAEFPKMFWVETRDSSAFNNAEEGVFVRLYSTRPELLAGFKSVAVKPEVASLILVSESASKEFLEFKIEPSESNNVLKANFFAIFQFDDIRVPYHTELIRNTIQPRRL